MSEHSFGTVVRQKNPSILDEDVNEAIVLLKKLYPRITRKIISKPYDQTQLQKVENECNQILRDMRLAGYYNQVPRVRIIHELANGRINQLSLEYY